MLNRIKSTFAALRRLPSLLVLALVALVCLGTSACAFEERHPVLQELDPEGRSIESVSYTTQGLSRCQTDPGASFPWICIWDANTPGVWDDDVIGRDVAVRDDRTDCYRLDLKQAAVNSCFLSKGWHPDGGSHRRDSLLVRDNYLAADRTIHTWAYSRGTNPRTACPSVTVNTCSL